MLCNGVILSLCHFRMTRKGGPTAQRGGKFFEWMLYCPKNADARRLPVPRETLIIRE